MCSNLPKKNINLGPLDGASRPRLMWRVATGKSPLWWMKLNVLTIQGQDNSLTYNGLQAKI
jgi:hypothetical protein